MHGITVSVRAGISYDLNHMIALVLSIVEVTSVEDADSVRRDPTGCVLSAACDEVAL